MRISDWSSDVCSSDLDAGKFLPAYVQQGIFARDPFVSLDIEGVGQLVGLAAERGRVTRPDIKLGICGENGGRSEEHTSELQSLMRISYAVFCLKKKRKTIDSKYT